MRLPETAGLLGREARQRDTPLTPGNWPAPGMAAASQEAPCGEEALEDRLRRLVRRRQQAARWQQTPEGSSDDEGEARPPLQRGAMQALRELLQERAPALDGAGSAEQLDLQGPVGLAATHVPASRAASPPDREQALAAQGAPQGPGSDGLGAAELPAAAIQDPPSVPATARALISLASGIAWEEARSAGQLRTTEQQDADVAVREAEVGAGGNTWPHVRPGGLCMPSVLPVLHPLGEMQVGCPLASRHAAAASLTHDHHRRPSEHA